MIEPPEEPLKPSGWAIGVLRSLTTQNVLTLALLAVVGVPSYFCWKFLTDESFRHEFISTARIVDAGVPCEVVVGNLGQKEDRHTVTVSYKFVNRLEYLIAIRSQRLLSNSELNDACREAHSEAAKLNPTHKEQ